MLLKSISTRRLKFRYIIIRKRIGIRSEMAQKGISHDARTLTVVLFSLSIFRNSFVSVCLHKYVILNLWTKVLLYHLLRNQKIIKRIFHFFLCYILIWLFFNVKFWYNSCCCQYLIASLRTVQASSAWPGQMYFCHLFLLFDYMRRLDSFRQ